MTTQQDNQNQLAPTSPLSVDLSTTGIPQRLEEFSDLEKMAQFYEELTYDVGTEIRTLITISKNETLPRLQLAAIKLLHDYRIEAMKLAGKIVTAKQSHISPTGDQQTISSQQVLNSLNSQPGSTFNEKECNHVQEERTISKGPEPVVNSPPSCGNNLPGLSSRPISG